MTTTYDDAMTTEEQARFRKLRGSMPYGAIVKESHGPSHTASDVLDYLEGLCRVLTRAVIENEAERRELYALRAERETVRSYFGAQD